MFKRKNTCVHVNVTLVLSSLHHLGEVIKLVTHTHVDLLIMTVFRVGEKKVDFSAQSTNANFKIYNPLSFFH